MTIAESFIYVMKGITTGGLGILGIISLVISLNALLVCETVICLAGLLVGISSLTLCVYLADYFA